MNGKATAVPNFPATDSRPIILWMLLFGLSMVLVGCGGAVQLMPTPNLYAKGSVDPFPDLPADFQNNKVDVLYFTDRAPEARAGGRQEYGFRRSRSVAFGVSQVDFGKDVSWDQLNKASRSSKRSVKLDLTVSKTAEIMRFPQTPRSLVKVDNPATAPASAPAPAIPSTSRILGDEDDAEQRAAEEVVQQELSARLAKTPVKEVYIFVHGYNNTFEDSVMTIAQLWHFFGRQGVPVAYSWPAGGSGLLRGYTYDSASSEFTVFHLKQMLSLIARSPDVKKIHIVCHSRGTDATLNALRELHMEISASGRSTREVLKLGTVVLAAPDIDLDIVIQKLTTVRLGQVPERFALYVHAKDKALGLSNWLFSGLTRLGELKADMFTPQELEVLRSSQSVQIIDARISDSGAFGHNYFHSSPSVSSDLILLMRYQLPPGAVHGRPLVVDRKGFWVINDNYPGESAPPEITGEETE